MIEWTVGFCLQKKFFFFLLQLKDLETEELYDVEEPQNLWTIQYVVFYTVIMKPDNIHKDIWHAQYSLSN